MNLDLKSVVFGLVLGCILALAFGAAGSGGGDAGFGFAVPSGSKALVKSAAGDAFIIDVSSGSAEKLLYKHPEPGSAKYPSNVNGYELKLAD